MKLEQQCCSLALAKKLKELGVKQESLFCWTQKDTYKQDEGEWVLEYEKDLSGTVVWTAASAFTVAELGEMLPKQINIPFKNGTKRKLNHRLYLGYDEFFAGGPWRVMYSSYNSNERQYQTADTEADARAKMLIYLLENKLHIIN